MTNREWINNLSNKEFAKLIYNYSACDCCILHGMENINCKQDCFANMEKWFAQEHIIPLKKCPFCGGKGKVDLYDTDGDIWEAGCDECGCNLGIFNTKEQAVKAWNKRIGDEK